MRQILKKSGGLFISLLVLTLLTACAVSQGSARRGSSRVVVSGAVKRDGLFPAKAVVMQSKGESAGVSSEYVWPAKHYPGYKMRSQELIFYKNKPFDLLVFDMPDGSKHKIYFNISSFFGKL